jgi:hypothetical protein
VRRSKKREGGCMSVNLWWGKSKKKGKGVRGWWGKKRKEKRKRKNVIRGWWIKRKKKKDLEEGENIQGNRGRGMKKMEKKMYFGSCEKNKLIKIK